MNDQAWEIVEGVLIERLSAHFSEPEQGRAWVESLRACDDDGFLLGVSLAIDLLSETVDAATLAKGLAKLPQDLNPVISFGRMPRTACVSECACEMTYEHRHYVRVMELSSFITYFLKLIPDPATVDAVRREYLADPRAGTLGEIERPWSGARGVVWVLPAAEYEPIRAEHQRMAAELLNDVLGLGYETGCGADEKPEFIAVRYPPDFEEQYSIRPRKPTSLDAAWEPAGFYISYPNEDGWGRTHSCSGADILQRERVHGTLERLSDEFTIESVGDCMPPRKNRRKLTERAFQRLLAMLDPSRAPRQR